MLKQELKDVHLPTNMPTKLDNLMRPYAATVAIPPQRVHGLLGSDPLGTTSSKQKACDLNRDYLADGGKTLDETVAADFAGKQRLEEALGLFTMAEQASLELVKGFLDVAVTSSSNL